MLAHQIENGNKPKLTRKAKDKIARQKSLMTRYSKGNIELGIYQLQMGLNYVKKARTVESNIEDSVDYLENMFQDVNNAEEDDLVEEYHTLGLHEETMSSPTVINPRKERKGRKHKKQKIFSKYYKVM